MSDIERSVAIEAVREGAGKSCALQAHGDRESWFCAADEYEQAIVRLEAENAELRAALERYRERTP